MLQNGHIRKEGRVSEGPGCGGKSGNLEKDYVRKEGRVREGSRSEKRGVLENGCVGK